MFFDSCNCRNLSCPYAKSKIFFFWKHQCWFCLIQTLASRDIHYISTKHFTSLNNTLLFSQRCDLKKAENDELQSVPAQKGVCTEACVMTECAPSDSVLNHIPLFHQSIFIAFLFSCLFNFGSSTLFWSSEKILNFCVAIWKNIPKSLKVKTRYHPWHLVKSSCGNTFFSETEVHGQRVVT